MEYFNTGCMICTELARQAERRGVASLSPVSFVFGHLDHGLSPPLQQFHFSAAPSEGVSTIPVTRISSLDPGEVTPAVLGPALGSQHKRHRRAGGAGGRSPRWLLRWSVSCKEERRGRGCGPGEGAARDPSRGVCHGDGAGLFAAVPHGRTRGNGHKPNPRRVPLNIRSASFALKVTREWHELPREVVESLPLDVLKSHLDVILSNLVLRDLV